MASADSIQKSPPRPVTIKDIAARLGISPSTVARALAKNPRISEKTSTLVRATAEEMGYVLNSSARDMRRGESKLIGLIVPEVLSDFYASIAGTLSQICEMRGFQLVLSISDNNAAREADQVASLVSARASGIIIVPTAFPHERTLELLRRTKHIQLLRRIPQLPSDWFGIDNHSALRMATRHLISFGHRSIAYIGGREDMTTGKARLAGFRTEMREAGLLVPVRFVELGEPAIADGHEAMLRLLRLKSRPTAVVIGSVGSTIGALHACRSLRVAIPEDISVVGFGDDLAFEWWREGLTTIAFPVDELAAESAEWLIKRIRQQGIDAGSARESVHPCSLIIRSSVGAPAG